MAAVVHGEGPGMYVTGTMEEIQEWQDAYAKANGLPTLEDRAEQHARRMAQMEDDLAWLDREIADAEYSAVFSPVRFQSTPQERENDTAARMEAAEQALRLRRLREVLR